MESFRRLLRFFRAHWRGLGFGLAGLTVFLLWLAFPQPDPNLWPPRNRDDRFSLFVTVNDFHTCINFPDYTLGLFQEWHMGAREWYLSRNPKMWEVVTRSVAGKVPAVIRFGVFFRPYWERENIPPGEVFRFWLSPQGYSRMVTALHEYRGREMTREGEYWYFPYLRGYHLLQNCNSFTASVLIAAGLPLREALAQEGFTMTRQLRRCQAIQEAAKP